MNRVKPAHGETASAETNKKKGYIKMAKKRNELEKPGPDASVLEIEEYERKKREQFVNIYDGAARMSCIYGCLSLFAALVGMIWNFVKPIVRGKFMMQFEGFFYAFNIYRIVSGYVYAIIILIFGLVALNLWHKSKEANPEYMIYRKAGLISGALAAGMQPISMIIVTIQAINYLATFN